MATGSGCGRDRPHPNGADRLGTPSSLEHPPSATPSRSGRLLSVRRPSLEAKPTSAHVVQQQRFGIQKASIVLSKWLSQNGSPRSGRARLSLSVRQRCVEMRTRGAMASSKKPRGRGASPHENRDVHGVISILIVIAVASREERGRIERSHVPRQFAFASGSLAFAVETACERSSSMRGNERSAHRSAFTRA
jgi:hypothetical protein